MTITQDSNAYVPGFIYYDDNLLLLRATLAQIVRRTRQLPAIRLLSLGLGHRYLVNGLHAELGNRLLKHVVIEGSAEIVELFEREMEDSLRLELIQGYFEDFQTTNRFDVIEMGFVLEHVDDPGLILRRFKTFLAPGGRLMIAVPNARSLHRLIGHQAGLLSDLHALGDADRALGHQRYFDPAQLEALLAENDLEVVGRAGLMLKPLTTGQLGALGLDERTREAMNEVGFDLPDICNGLFVEAQPCR
jgi:2-polyprenyl-3-methyl-5-hydroxy-6-metoxy-1,4-benzoquinol methylase